MKTYDKMYRFTGDKRDKATKMKIDGFVDHQKFNDWKNVLKRSISRRKSRRHKIQAENKIRHLSENISIESLEQE